MMQISIPDAFQSDGCTFPGILKYLRKLLGAANAVKEPKCDDTKDQYKAFHKPPVFIDFASSAIVT